MRCSSSHPCRYFVGLAILFGWHVLVYGQPPSTAVGMATAAESHSDLCIVDQRCEYVREPLGIDEPFPRLSWILQSDERGQKQTAYQVLVASGPELLAKDNGDLWDSGRVESDQSTHVVYAGKPLASRMRCFWKVRVWDQGGRESPWSESARWTMGLLKPEDWQAKWIIASDWLADQSWIWFPYAGKAELMPPGKCYFRTHLPLPQGAVIREARVIMAADDAFTLFINGKQTLQSDDRPAIKSADVTKWLQGGDNILAVAATNKGSAPNMAGLVGKITVVLADGREVILDTDSSWKTSDHPKSGWQDVALNDDSWRPARELGKYIRPLSGPRDTSRDNFQMDETHWLRKTFVLDELPECGAAYVNVKGFYELYVNGQKVGTDVLSPPTSSYKRRSYCLTYDIKPYLRKGKNSVGLWLGYGWYWPGYPGVRHSRPIARVQLEFETGGKSSRVVTDAAWQSHPSSYRLLGHWWYDEFGGECLDARRDVPDWCRPDSDEKGWTQALVVSDPSGPVSTPMCPPNRIKATLPAVACTDLGNGFYELDFGKCLTGWLRLRMPLMEQGRKVKIFYAEKRFQSPQGDDTPAGHIRVDCSCETFETAGGPVCYQTFHQGDEFTSAGRPNEQFCSKFNFHVFRYAMVQGLPEKPSLGDAEALSIESDLASAGTFSCSNSLLNRIHDVTLWSNRSWSLGGYFAELGRERDGYGPIELALEPTIMTLDVPALMTKWAENWLDDQNPTTGENLYTAPMIDPLCGGGPAWGATVTPLSWAMYLYYGDQRLLKRCYEPGQRYLEFLEKHCQDDLLVRAGPFDHDWLFLGDWLPPDHGSDAKTEAAPQWPPPRVNAAFNNCYRVYLWRLLERAARVLGEADDVRRCEARIPEICRHVHESFYDPKKHTYILESQTYQALPLFAQTVPEAERDAVRQTLENNILVRRQGHIDTGAFGSWFLIQYLQQIGRNDLIYIMVNQRTYPGWGYMVEQGATTLWEQWNGYRAPSCNLYTAVGSWFYSGLGGIQPDPSVPGFRRIIIRPAVVGDLTWVKSSYRSVHGTIVSDWRRDNGVVILDVTIPTNTTATIYVPTTHADSVTENGRPAAEATGVKFLRIENGCAVFAVESGKYGFAAAL